MQHKPEEAEQNSKRKYAMRRTAAKALPNEAVCRSGRHSLKDWKTGRQLDVSIWSGEYGASYGGIISCGSVWHCPVCAAKIAARRSEEVANYARMHAEEGGVIFMATFTIPHHGLQSCNHLRNVVARAWSKLIAGDPWKRQRERFGISTVRALEVTHGGNGWHPHLHVLFYLNCEEGADELGDWLFERWQRTVQRLGHDKPSSKAWDWQKAISAETAAHYVAKAAKELTTAHMKLGRQGGRSAFQILEDLATNWNERDATLFREYAKAFKGARQLTYSNDLRERYKVDEIVDADVVQMPEPRSTLVARVSPETFRTLIKKGLEEDLLAVVCSAPTWLAVYLFLARQGIQGGIRPPVSG
jgi:hypothetical protein